MSKSKKILLSIALLLVAASTYFAFNHETWLAQFNAERQQQKAEFTERGQRFGQSGNQDSCLSQTLSQFGSCLGFECTVNEAVFLKSCLNSAAASEGFCDGVPAYSEKLSKDAKQWLKDRCWDVNVNGEGCRFLLKQHIYFCSQQ
ncbi:MAG: hypothetical protein ACPG4U_09840 [Pseudomonadales bacterium]